jgi:hypothetical protein
VVGFTTGSRGKVPGKTCEKRIRKIMKEEIESRCRLRKEYEETIDYLTSGCPILAKNEYVIRHDRICTHLYYSICKTLSIETTEN